MRLARAPLLHFLAAGLALFAAERTGIGRALAASDRAVEVSRSAVLQLAAEARRELGREPRPDELTARVAARVDEELLVREARALGWHRSDPVVRMRLVQNLRFVSPEDAEAEPDALLERAYALGMDETDVVVRRRLADTAGTSASESPRPLSHPVAHAAAQQSSTPPE